MAITRRLRSAFVATCILPALVACGGDPEPKIADPSPSTDPEVPTETPTPPSPPESATDDTRAGAEAFVRYFLEVSNYAQDTGDTADLASLSDSTCRPCTSGLQFIDETYADGGKIEGGEATLRGPETERFRTSTVDGFQIRGKVANTDQVVDLPGTKRDDSFGASTVSAQFVVELRDAGWAMVFWDIS